MFADRVWDEVKDFSSRSIDQGGLGVDQTKEQTFFELDERALVRVIQDQIKIAEVMKRKAESGKLKMPLKGVAIVLDDVLDNPRVRRYSSQLDLLASRARHAFISFFCSTQYLKSISSVVRANSRTIYCFRLRSPILPLYEEAAGMTSKEEFLRMYERAISESHGFLTIRMDGEPGQTFFSKFGENLQAPPEHSADDASGPPSGGSR